MSIDVCMCVCALVLHPLIFLLRGGMIPVLSSDYMSFLSSNLIEEIQPNPEAGSANT